MSTAGVDIFVRHITSVVELTILLALKASALIAARKDALASGIEGVYVAEMSPAKRITAP